MARPGAHQVEAGLVNADPADLHAAAKQSEQPDGSSDLAGVEHRFGAVGWILRNAQIRDHKSGPRQKARLTDERRTGLPRDREISCVIWLLNRLTLMSGGTTSTSTRIAMAASAIRSHRRIRPFLRRFQSLSMNSNLPAYRVTWNVRLQRVSVKKCSTTWPIQAMRGPIPVWS